MKLSVINSFFKLILRSKSYIEDILAEEYHQLFLFFFVGQIIGISLLINSKIIYIQFIVLFWFYCFVRRANTIINFWLKIILSGIVFGVFVTGYKMYTNVTKDIDGEYLVSGRIIQIKPKYEDLILIVKVDFLNELDSNDVDKILLRVKVSEIQSLMIGDEIFCIAKLASYKMENWFMNSNNFNLQYKINGISASGFIKKVIDIKPNNIGFLGLLYKIRKNIYDILVERMGENGHFIAALILGETGRLSSDVLNAARATGISHILCVSGLHLSVICFIFFKMTRFLFNCSDFIALRLDVKKLSASIAILASIMFLLISGMQIASTRACIMTTLSIFGIFLDRPNSSIRIIFLTGVIMLALNPEYLYHPSFQLSYLAVLGIVSAPKTLLILKNLYIKSKLLLSKYLLKKTISPIRMENSLHMDTIYIGGVAGYFLTNIYITSLVSLVTMPVVIHYFYFFANYSVMANLIIVPITSFILMPLSVISIMCIGFNIEEYPIFLLNHGVNITIKIIKYIAKWPYATFHIGFISYELVSFCVICFLLFIIFESRTKYIFGLSFMIGISCIFLSSRPNVIVTENMVIIKDQELEIHTNKYKKYTFQKITNWLGMQKFKYYKDFDDGLWYYKNLAIINREIYNCENFTKYKVINISDNTKCKVGDVNLKDLIDEGYFLSFE